jgi:hypothetical protein
MNGKVIDIIEEDSTARAVIEISLDDADRLWEKMDQEVVISWAE